MFPYPIYPIRIPDTLTEKEDREKVEELLGPDSYSDEHVLEFVVTHSCGLSDALRDSLRQLEVNLDPSKRLTIPVLADALEHAAILNQDRVVGFLATMGYLRDCRFVYAEYQRVLALYAGNSQFRFLTPLAELGDLLHEMTLALEEGPIVEAP